jgi:hypothetical protein
MSKNKPKSIKSTYGFIIAICIIGIFFLIFFLYLRPNSGVKGLLKATKNDPLFVSPELDIVEFNKSLEQLKLEQEELKEAIGLSDEVVATRFLNKLPQVKESERIFFEKPDKTTGQSLIKSYREATSEYKNSAILLKGHLLEAFPLEKEQPFISFGSMTTNRIMAADLDLMMQNADKLSNEIDSREAILNNKSFYTTKKLKPNNQAKVSNFVYSDSKPPIYPEFFPVYLVSTDCYGSKDKESIFSYFGLTNRDGLKVFKPRIANDRYYQKLSEGIPAEKQLIDQGVEWRIITDGNTYRCNNLEFQADLRTLVAFTDQYKGNPIFTTENKNKEKLSSKDSNYWDEANKLEEKLVGQDSYFSNSDLEELANYYRYFSAVVKNRDMASELKKRELFIINKQAKINEIINTYFFLDDLYKRAKTTNYKDKALYAKQLYGSRMSYSFVFLNFSNAVWRLDKSPQYVGDFTNNDHFKTIQELKQKYSDEIIRKMDEILYIEVRGY